MISIKRYGYIVNKQFKVNKKRNLSIISGIILSIILFTIVGYIQDYYTQIELLNTEGTVGKYEAIVTNASYEEIDKLKNNILVNQVGIYSLLYSSAGIEKEKDIFLYAADNVAINELFSTDKQLLKGNFPKNKNEIMIDSIGKEFFNKNIGDTINFNNKDYKIVGIHNKFDLINMYGIDLVTYLGESSSIGQMNAVFNVKSEKNKDKVIEKVLGDIGINYNPNDVEEKVLINKRLMYRYSEMGLVSKGYGESINFRADLISYFVILVLSIVLTYNSINVSIRERITQFSILRCIGASTSKIKILLIKESFFLALYSIVPGIILGQLVCYFIVFEFLNKLVNINNYEISYTINFKLIVVILFLSIVNIAVSTIIPILKVGNISPIEGIKNKDYKSKKIKKSNSKKIRKYLGYNMEIAYKNIRGNYRDFFTTTITSVVLLTSFIALTGYSKNIIKNANQEDLQAKDISLNMSLAYRDDYNNVLDLLKYHEENIKNLGITENIFAGINYNITGIFKDLEFDKNIRNDNPGSSNGHVNTSFNNKKIAYSDNINLVIMDEKFLEDTISQVKDNSITKEDFKDNGVIITDTIAIKNLINATRVPWLDLKKGEEFTLAIKGSENSRQDKSIDKDIKYIFDNSKEVKLKYLGSIDGKKVIDGGKFGFSYRPTLLVSEDFYNNNKELFLKENGKSYLTSDSINISMDLKSNINREQGIRSISNYANLHEDYILDNKANNLYFKNNAVLIYRLVNLIMFVTIIMGGVIMINNKIISINLRGKEIGTLLAIGISKKRIKKIFILESIIQWVISSVISLALSYTILKIMYEILIYNLTINKGEMPVFEMIFGCIILLIINILGSYLPIRKLKYINTTELIKNNE